MIIQAVPEIPARIAESPTWVAGEGALYWIDIKAPALHRYCPDGEATRTWPVRSDFGGLPWRQTAVRSWRSGTGCSASISRPEL